ncbi:hypothetical protein LTR85_007212 [Meristemomyces frigidus]|nr:hypothetical protein LTR85_007212 [Meristemomyces frigidus]
MVVNTAPANQVRGSGRSRYVDTPSSSYGTGPYGGRHYHHAARPRYQCRAVQTTPAWEKVTDLMAVDLEGCQRNGTHYVGSFSAVSRCKQTVYDVFADHGGWRTDEQFITALPPKYLNLGVDWPDLNPANGARPIQEVLENAIELMVGRTIVFHDAGADMRMLNHSAAMCGIEIPWSKITIRDTQRFHGWQWFARGHQGPALKDCVAQILKIQNFQANGHSGRDDAAHTMELYLREEAAIERQYASMTTVQQTAALASSSAGTDSESEEKSAAQTPGTSPSIDGLVEGTPNAQTDLHIGTAAAKPISSQPLVTLFAPTSISKPNVRFSQAKTTVKTMASNQTSTSATMPAARAEKPIAAPLRSPAVAAPVPRSWAQIANTPVLTTTQSGQQQKPAVLKKR